ncbi:MAG: L-threonylcarbamoyladenylate synthase [bacterium]|nr:Sua5/YciO/YrdC/YwlC family protein [Gammaproteobacteria bacterium]HIL97783.1 Sua5/YciO/YrdC/YwlC family protein [Pseudomonadales bacterium]
MQPFKWRVKLAARYLFEEAVIAYPTEGVWGLGCLAASEAAVQRILILKRRSWKQGLILVASEIAQILPYSQRLSEDQLKMLKAAWPGPVTYLLPRSSDTPDYIAGQHDTVAVRVSDHPVVRAICKQVEGPLVSTSANPSGKVAATSALRVRQYFPQGIDYFFPGKLGGVSGASEIRDLLSGDVIRSATR